MSKVIAKRLSLFVAFLMLLLADSAGAKRDKVLDIPFGGVQVFDRTQAISSDGTTVTTRFRSNIPKMLGVSSTNVLAEWYAGANDPAYPSDLLDISGNDRHLADAGTTPVVEDAVPTDGYGNFVKSFLYDGSSGRHFAAHSSWMNCFSTSFSISILVKMPSSPPATTAVLFEHGVGNTDGFLVYMASTGYIWARLSKSAAKDAITTTSFADGLYHLVTYVRNGDAGTLYIDGIPVAIVTGLNDGYGLDQNRELRIGADLTGNYWAGNIAYTRLQNTALSYSQVMMEYHLWTGSAASNGYGGGFVLPTFCHTPDLNSPNVEYGSGKNSLVGVPYTWPIKTNEGLVIEPGVLNYFSYTTAFSTNWIKSGTCTISGTSVVLPDGSTRTTNTFHEGTDAATTHYLQHNVSVTNTTSYDQYFYVKYNRSAGTPREWVKLFNGDGVNSNVTYFNIRYGLKGTETKALTGSSAITPMNNGWFRINQWITAGRTGTGGQALYVAEANNDDTFTGQNQDSVFVSFPQAEATAFPSPQFNCTATSCGKSQDHISIIPFRISDDLRYSVNATPRLLFLGNESLAGATVTPTVGAYSFTKNGKPQNIESYAEGSSFYFNGPTATDYLSISSADFGPTSQSFSVVFAVTSYNTTLSNIASRTGGAGSYGWDIYLSVNDVWMMRSKDGTNRLWAGKTGSPLQLGKPSLVTCVFDSAAGMKVYVDGLTVGTEPTLGSTNAPNANFNIGYSSYSPAYNYGKLHYFAYYNNYAVSSSEHAAMYAKFKQDGILPLTMSATTAKKKLAIEFDAKTMYSSNADLGSGSRMSISISGAAGVASGTQNNIQFKYATDSKIYFEAYEDSDATQRYIRSAAQTDWNRWKTYKATLDFSNYANSTFYINGVAQTDPGSMTGTGNAMDFRDSLIRFGQTNAATVNGYVELRNVKLYTE